MATIIGGDGDDDHVYWPNGSIWLMGGLHGTAEDDHIYGNGGNDLLMGEGGNDTLHGGEGADEMQGGDGSDSYYVDNTGDIVDEFWSNGHDTVNSSVNFTLRQGVEDLVLLSDWRAVRGIGNSLENRITANGNNNFIAGHEGNDTILGMDGRDELCGDQGDDTLFGGGHDDVLHGSTGEDALDGGTGHDTLNGGANRDTLFGRDGHDTLDGGTGGDVMAGGGDNDTYFVDSYGDEVTEVAGQGYDTVNSTIGYTLRANFEALTLQGTAVAGTGNALGNVLKGNASDNILSGAGGMDTLIGNGGGDTLRGGTGCDTLTGGTGRDFFDFDTINSSVPGNPNRDTITDFARGRDGDRIDLRDIDANSFVDDNQRFDFIGRDAFGGQPGELRFIDLGARVIVQADVDGDTRADFEVMVRVGAIAESDFML